MGVIRTGSKVKFKDDYDGTFKDFRERILTVKSYHKKDVLTDSDTVTIEEIGKSEPHHLISIENLEPITVIKVMGCRWFQKSCGNTYCSAKIFINDKLVHTLEIQYGYERYYEQASEEWLVKNNYIASDAGVLWRFCEENNIDYIAQAKDVKLERELKQFASEQG